MTKLQTNGDFYFNQIYLEFRLKPTWDWLLTVMDATEAQLKFGASLTNSLDLTSPGHPLNAGINAGGGQRTVPAATLASLGVLASSIYLCPLHACRSLICSINQYCVQICSSNLLRQSSFAQFP